jgi:tRNA modification GTPase
MDTIYALASARGKAGVSVIRISGDRAISAGQTIARSLPENRKAGVRRLVTSDGMVIDEALVLVFPIDSSFTGEETVEFQTHGSTAVVNAVLEELSKQPGLRHAEPGEFTRRALENERLDLAQVEGLADLIEAETEAQRQQAMRVFSGALGDKVEGWRTQLIRAAALLEATIDFADEEVPEDVTPEVRDLMTSVQLDFLEEAAGSRIAERIREGFEVALIGAPNVGKSTLLNALAGREAAITSEIAGTTRDVIEVRMDLAGLPVTLLDTAGLRDSVDQVEAIGVGLARQRADAADLRVFLSEDGEEPDGVVLRDEDIRVRAKADLVSGGSELAISGKTGVGIDALVARIGVVLNARAGGAGVAVRARHRHALVVATRELESAVEVMDQDLGDEITAQHLRNAVIALDSLIGRVDVEHILDEIFASFCLGK